MAWCRRDGTVTRAKLTELLVTEGLERAPAESAGPGDIIAVAGIDEITIGETIADADDPRPLPLIVVDEPSISMTLGANTSPLASLDGSKLTARMIKDRLDQEILGNVSLRVLDTERPDTWEVQGRGELQFAVLAEIMRREGFELTIGKPRVVTREVDGKLHEPVERVSIDLPEEYAGVVIQALALRKGRMESMNNHGTGWVRLEHLVPARGLLGFRSEFQTETRGTGQLHHVFEGYQPWAGEIKNRPNGSLIADRRGQATGYAIQALQERGILFVGVGRRGVRGHGGGREQPRRRPRRQHHQGQADDQRALQRRGAGAAQPAAHDEPRSGHRVHPRRRVHRGHPPASGCARPSCGARSATANAPKPPAPAVNNGARHRYSRLTHPSTMYHRRRE